MMSRIDDDSTSMNDLTEHFTHNFFPCMEKMELYTDNGSSSMEDMVEHHYDIDSSCMRTAEGSVRTSVVGPVKVEHICFVLKHAPAARRRTCGLGLAAI